MLNIAVQSHRFLASAGFTCWKPIIRGVRPAKPWWWTGVSHPTVWLPCQGIRSSSLKNRHLPFFVFAKDVVPWRCPVPHSRPCHCQSRNQISLLSYKFTSSGRARRTEMMRMFLLRCAMTAVQCLPRSWLMPLDCQTSICLCWCCCNFINYLPKKFTHEE